MLITGFSKNSTDVRDAIQGVLIYGKGTLLAKVDILYLYMQLVIYLELKENYQLVQLVTNFLMYYRKNF